MQSLNLLTRLLFITINFNLVFGFPQPFYSQDQGYEVNYSEEEKHEITNINGAEEEIINIDQTLSGHNTELFTDEIENHPNLLMSIGYNLPPNSEKISSLVTVDEGDTPNNYNIIYEKVYSLHEDPALINLNPFNGVNSNDELKFLWNFNEIFYNQQNLGPDQILDSQDSTNDKNSNGNELIIDYFEVPWKSLFNFGNFYDQKNSQDNVTVSKRDTYQNNSVKQEDKNSQKSDQNLNTSAKPVETVKPIIDKSCDDGRTNLEVDWDGSKGDYVCNADVEIQSNSRPSTLYCDPSVSVVQPKTRCMNETLEYSELIPVIGDYRPVAPQLGEYKFIPAQRWLNSLDNDAVVLLYHPCAVRSALNKLRLLIMKYYERYIFTPYNLEETAPFAIVVKGCRLVMSHVEPNEVAHFLQNHGPQKVPLGKPNYIKTKYNLGLIEENRRHHLFGMFY